MPETPGQKIQRQIAAIKAQGGTDADVATFLSSHPGVEQVGGGEPTERPSSPAGSFLAPIAQGATLGFADEILGGINGANEALHGRSFKAGYDEGRAKVQGVGEQFASEHPVTSAALNVAGSIVPVVATGGASALESGASAGARAASMAKAGAGYGAVAGFGGGDGGVGGRTKSALTGGIVGAAMAPLIDVGMRGAGSVMGATPIPSWIARGASAMADKMPDGPIAQTLRSVAGSVGPAGRANAAIADRLSSEGSSADEVAARVAAQPTDKPEILADYSPEARALTKSVVKQPGKGRALINAVLGNRAAGTRGRVLSDLGNPSPVEQHLETMIRERAASGAELFPAAYKAGEAGIDDPVVNEIMSRPTFKAAMPLAKKMAADDGVTLPTKSVVPEPTIPGIDPEKWKAAAIANGLTEEEPIPDVRTLHYVTRAVAGMAHRGLNGGALDNGHAVALRDAVGALRDRMTQIVPEFATAMDDYAKRSAEIDAVKTGNNIMQYVRGTKTPPQALGKGDPLALKAAYKGVAGVEIAVDKMAPEHRALFRLGAQGAMRDAVNRVPSTLEGSTAPVLKKVFADSPEGRRWQRLLFDTPSESAGFQKALYRERTMAATKARMGGSDTAENLNERDAVTPTRSVVAMASHPISAARSLLASGGKTADKQFYQELGKRLSAAGKDPLIEMLGETSNSAKLARALRQGQSAARNAIVVAARD